MRKSSSHIAFCPEHYTEIENYDKALADNFIGWVCHHRNGEEFSREWLIKNNMYYNRTDPHEFKFVTVQEHGKLHGMKGSKNPFFGRHHTFESKEKMRNSQLGIKRRPCTEEHKAKIAAARRGKKHSAETKKKMSESQLKRFGRND